MNPPSLSISVLKYFAIKGTEAAILEKGFQEILRKNPPFSGFENEVRIIDISTVLA